MPRGQREELSPRRRTKRRGEAASALAGIAPRRFDAVLYVGPRSRACGKTVSRARRWTGNKMAVQRVQRGAETLTATDTLVLLEGDRLLANDLGAYVDILVVGNEPMFETPVADAARYGEFLDLLVAELVKLRAAQGWGCT